MSFRARTSSTARRPRAFIAGVVVAVLAVAFITIRSTNTPRATKPVVAQSQNIGRIDALRDAVAVGVDAATVLSRVFPMTSADARATVSAIASDSYRPALLAAIDRELVPLQRQAASLPGKTFFRQSVLATQRVNASPRTATVAVWMLIVVGQAGQQANPAGSFVTVTVDLVVEHGAWKLDRVAQQAGPTPLLAGQPDLIDSFDQRLIGFSDWRN